MAVTVTRNPTSDDTFAGTWTGTPGSRWTLVDDYPDTTGVDILTHGTTAGTGVFLYSTPFALPAGATAISVFVDYYDNKSASQAATIGARLKVGGSYFNSATHNPAQAYTQRTDTFATNPKTSAAWTVSDINGIGANALQGFGWNSGADASPTILLSSIRLRVTYTMVYTLDAQPASFGESGADATTTTRRLLPGGAGSYALAGAAAQLASARLLAASGGAFVFTGALATFSVATGATSFAALGGAFALNGAAATLLTRRTLGASAGGYALNGAAAAIVARRELAATGGAFALGGAAAQLTARRALSANVGGFALGGAPVQFAALRALVAGGGALALTGAPLQFAAARVLPADAAGLALTGAPAQLAARRSLPASSAGFALAGQAATLRANRVLDATTGALALAGAPATLAARRAIGASAGALALSGAAATFTFIPAPEPGGPILWNAAGGSFALAGASATMAATRRLDAGAGAFGFAGASATFVVSRVLQAGAGSFALTGAAATFVHAGVTVPVVLYNTGVVRGGVAYDVPITGSAHWRVPIPRGPMGRNLFLDNLHTERVGPCPPRDDPDGEPYSGDDVVAFWALQSDSNIPAASLTVTRDGTIYTVSMTGIEVTEAFDGLADRTMLTRVVMAASGAFRVEDPFIFRRVRRSSP